MIQKPDDSAFRRGFKTWCENVSLQYRKEMGLSPSDPIDLRQLAARQDVIIWRADEIPEIDENTLHILTKEDPDSWSAFTLLDHGRKLIILNPANSLARTNSDLAHELSHLIIGHDGIRVDITPDNLLMLHNYGRQQESEADWLAGCLLLPRPAVLHIRRVGLDDAKARSVYGVSESMLTFRVNVTGVDRQLGNRGGGFKRRTGG